jgi:ATP-dependent RNA helicase RhlE
LSSSFDALLPSLKKTLKDKSLTTPTEIQTKIIPLMLEGKSVVGIAETGSGKTLAYALPVLHAAKTREQEGDHVTDSGRPLAIIMVPTRELGEQIAKVFKEYTHETRLRVRSALGGTTLEQSRKNVSSPFEILLGTPGRIVQLLKQELIDLSDVVTLVFDEADQMMDQGFMPDSETIAEACPEEIQLAMFSATESEEVQKMMETLFEKANVIRTQGAGKTVGTLKTKNVKIIDGKRWNALEPLLEDETKTILFTNTREQADKLLETLKKNGIEAGLYRGDMDKVVRRKTIQSFRAGKLNLLVSTELGSRGLDIENVDRIINYNMPKDVQNYVHRAGRTARAGREGLVVNLIEERDQKVLEKVRQLGQEGLKDPTAVSKAGQRDTDRTGAHTPKPKLTRKQKERRRETVRKNR